MPVELVTRPGVPIARTGSYLLGSGPATFTEEDLQAALTAWLHDPTVPDRPRLRISNLEASGLVPGDHGGEPAFGYMDNPRLGANGQELLADVHVPEWLDAVLDWAYPSRSIEGAQRVTAASGTRYDFVITGMALLGVELPGISSLDDFGALLAGEIGEAPEPQAVLASAARDAGIGDVGQYVRAGMDADIVRRRLVDAMGNGDLPLPDGVERYDCWPIALRFDDGGQPYAKVIDEGSGRLYRTAITVSGNEVTFGELVEIVEQDVPVAAGAPVAAQSVMWAVRAEDRPNTNTEDDMDPATRAAIAKRLGLSEDATDEQIKTAAENVPPPPADPTPIAGDPPANPPPVESDPGQADSERVPVAASAPEGTMIVSEAAWNDQQARLAQIEADNQARAERETGERRDRIVANAVATGRITPAERETWRGRLDKSEEVTAETLASLPASRAVPVHETGGTPQDPSDGGAEREISDDDHERTMAAMGIRVQPRRRGFTHDRQEA